MTEAQFGFMSEALRVWFFEAQLHPGHLGSIVGRFAGGERRPAKRRMTQPLKILIVEDSPERRLGLLQLVEGL